MMAEVPSGSSHGQEHPRALFLVGFGIFSQFPGSLECRVKGVG